jgi:DNA polymerase/3'-5' exonuclease PolX
LLALPINDSFWEEQRLLAELLAMLEKEGLNNTRSVADRLAEQAAAYIQKNYKEKTSMKFQLLPCISIRIILFGA